MSPQTCPTPYLINILHYRIISQSKFLYVNQIVSTNPNKVIYSFNNAADIQSFENSWETFPFHLDSASEIVDAFYSHIQLSIPLCFPKKRSKRIQQPFYYSSHSMHCLNKMNTLVRICSKNPRANNLAKLKRARGFCTVC